MGLVKKGAAFDSLVLTFVRFFTAFVSIIIYKLMAVYFSLAEYGVYSAAILISTTISSLTILGLSDAVNYFYNREEDEQKGRIYLCTIFFIQIIIGVVVAVGIVAFKRQIGIYFNNPDVVDMMLVIALMPLLTNLLSMLQVLFISFKKAKIIAIRNFIVSVIKVVVVLIVCIVIKDVKIVLIGSLATDFVMVVYMIVYCNKEMININILNADRHLIGEILKYSIPMAAYIMTNSLAKNIDKLVIGWFGSAEDLAIYTISSKELPFDMFTSAFITVLIPYITRYIANKDNKNAVFAFSKYIQLSYVITWILAMGAVSCSRDLMLVLYDEKYLVGNNIFNIYIVVEMIKFANVSLIFSVSARTKELLIYSGGALLSNLVLNIILYNLLGLVGPALATVIVTIILSLVMLKRSSSIIQSSLGEILNYRQVVTLLCECLVFGVVAFAVRKVLLTNLPAFIGLVVGFSIFIIPVMLMNYKKIMQLLKDINSLKM